MMILSHADLPQMIVGMVACLFTIGVLVMQNKLPRGEVYQRRRRLGPKPLW